MSGPKLSAAELERMRQEQLERERQEALRRLREAQSAYTQACNRIDDTKRYTLSLLDQIDAMYRRDAKRASGAILLTLKKIAITDDKDPQAYHAAAAAINRDVDKALSDLDEVLKQYLTRSKTDQSLSISDSMHQSFQDFVAMKTNPIDVTTINFSCDFGRKQLLDIVDQVIAHYKWAVKNGQSDLQRNFAKKSIKSLQSMLDRQNTLKDADLISFVQSIINEEADIDRRENQRKALYDDYVAIATLMDTEPKPPADFSSAEAIKKEIDDLYGKLRQKDEMDYIADQINDVMISLGYGFVTSRVLTRKDQSEMDCSLYQADDQTGIAVYTDQAGAVMMRMTVLGDNTDITDDDKDFSYQRQIDFCAGHQDIVNALAERGVYLKQKSYLEPDKKHTFKVNMKATGSTVQKDADGHMVLKKTKVDRRKRRRANKKKVRAM